MFGYTSAPNDIILVNPVYLVVQRHCRQTPRCRAEGSSICVCWDTLTERCLLWTLLRISSYVHSIIVC